MSATKYYRCNGAPGVIRTPDLLIRSPITEIGKSIARSNSITLKKALGDQLGSTDAADVAMATSLGQTDLHSFSRSSRKRRQRALKDYRIHVER